MKLAIDLTIPTRYCAKLGKEPVVLQRPKRDNFVRGQDQREAADSHIILRGRASIILFPPLFRAPVW